MNFELAYKEDLFFILSANMEKEEALKETERISSNFKSIYSPPKSKLIPIQGKETYRYFIRNHREQGWDMWYESRIDKYVNGKWETFMKYIDDFGKCEELVERLRLGGNTMINF